MTYDDNRFLNVERLNENPLCSDVKYRFSSHYTNIVILKQSQHLHKSTYLFSY